MDVDESLKWTLLVSGFGGVTVFSCRHTSTEEFERRIKGLTLGGDFWFLLVSLVTVSSMLDVFYWIFLRLCLDWLHVLLGWWKWRGYGYGYFTIGWHVLFLVMMKEISIKSFVVTIFGNLCFIVYNSFQPSTAITIFEFTQCIETDRFGSIFLINLVSEITNIWHKVVHKSPQVKDFIR